MHQLLNVPEAICPCPWYAPQLPTPGLQGNRTLPELTARRVALAPHRRRREEPSKPWLAARCLKAQKVAGLEIASPHGRLEDIAKAVDAALLLRGKQGPFGGWLKEWDKIWAGQTGPWRREVVGLRREHQTSEIAPVPLWCLELVCCT